MEEEENIETTQQEEQQQEAAPEKGKAGRPALYDYDDPEFVAKVEALARKGMNDAEIASDLGISSTTFSRVKTEHNGIMEALTRARQQINATVRAAFLRVALGGRRVRVESYVEKRCSCRGNDPECEICNGTGWITPEQNRVVTDTELAPSQSALNQWLMNHDPEWREKSSQKIDVTSGGKSFAPDKVNIEIVYNKKEDCDLQDGSEQSAEN
jgi:hypothetical protein